MAEKAADIIVMTPATGCIASLSATYGIDFRRDRLLRRYLVESFSAFASCISGADIDTHAQFFACHAQRGC